MSDWQEIAERAQQMVADSKAHRERLDKIEERIANRERRAQPSPSTATSTPSPTSDDRKAVALATLDAFVVGVPSAETTTKTREDDWPAVKKYKEREAERKARIDEKRAAAMALDNWFGRGVR